jgi:hypothetical protein
MNSNKKSDNFESIEINAKCETHGLSKNLVCGNEKCSEYNLFCSNCAAEDEQSCVISKKHEAVLFSEFLKKYIKNEKNFFVDVEKLNGIINEVKKLNTEDLTASLIEYIKTINNIRRPHQK